MKNIINYKFLLFCTLSLLFIASFLFLRQLNNLKSGGKFHIGRTRSVLIDVNKIQNWMTFDYINRSFSLPNDYLKNEFVITDNKYPRITITREALNKKENIDIFIAEVKKDIQKYIDSVNKDSPAVSRRGY